MLYILNYHDKDEEVAIISDYGLTSYAFSSDPPYVWAT